MNAEPQSTTHCNPIHICNIGFRVSCDKVIKLVFEAEVVYGESRIIRLRYDLLKDRRNISAGAKCLLARAGDDDYVGQLGVFPFL